MAERGRHIHHAVDDDRRGLQRFLDVGLEDPGDVQVLDVVAIDLLGGIKARLGVIAVGQQKIVGVLVGGVELLLGDRRNLRLARCRLGFLFGLLRVDWCLSSRPAAPSNAAHTIEDLFMVPAPMLSLSLTGAFEAQAGSIQIWPDRASLTRRIGKSWQSGPGKSAAPENASRLQAGSEAIRGREGDR